MVGIVGHQRIPEAAIPYIREALIEAIDELGGTVVGISSLAAGADQLFSGLVLARGGRLHVIVPSDRYEESFSDQADANHYRNLLSQAERVERLSHAAPSEDAYLDAGHRIVELVDQLVAIWDGRPARGKGGTADVVAYARSRGKLVTVIWPTNVKRD